jgi:hypothetical protein
MFAKRHLDNKLYTLWEIVPIYFSYPQFFTLLYRRGYSLFSMTEPKQLPLDLFRNKF